MSNINAVIFDLDGVIFDGVNMHFESLNEALASVDESIVVSEQEHDERFNGLPTKIKLQMLSIEHGLDDSLLPVIHSRKQERFQSKIQNLTENVQITEVLKFLKEKNKKIGLASNSIRKTVDGVLEKMNITEYFDAVFSNEDVVHSKPSPEIYTRCMDALGATPEETLIIEDSFVGKTGAKLSGAHVMPVADCSYVTRSRIDNCLRFGSKKVTVVIPMAGHGSRFSVAGFSKPKPFIDVLGKPMVQHVVENVQLLRAHYIFIVQKDHMNRLKSARDMLKKMTTNSCSIIEIEGVTEGAASTVLLAEKELSNEDPVIIANSDQIVTDFDVYEFVNKGIESDGHILCFKDPSRNPKWSYASVKDGTVRRVAEKEPISEFATVGIYFFDRGSNFVKYAKKMIDANIRTNDEFYLAPVYNEYIKDGKKITIQLTDAMNGIGTPEDLHVYLRTSKKSEQ